MTAATYLVVIRDEALCLIGPFAGEGLAANWARANNPNDDPRWQSIPLGSESIRDGTMSVSVLRPVDPRAKAFMELS